VVGGGLTGAGELLFGPLRQALARHARLGFTRDVSVVPAALGADAGLVGAAALVLAGDRYWSAD
jgi:glucokinase